MRHHGEQVYNATVHWNAVFNGEMKFIFHAFWPEGDGRQYQLFNVTASRTHIA